jgi:predicted DNA-binding WGR domain protein
MLTSPCIRLEARSAVHRCFRAYEIEVGTDLFGAWMVEMSYGRIGALGRSKARSFSTTEEAQAQVRNVAAARARGPAWRVVCRGERPASEERLAITYPLPGPKM